MTTIALADDHHLIRNALVELINRFEGFQVIFDVADGQQLIDKLESKNLPNIALVDINMPEMDGYQTTKYITKHFPQIKTVALSVEDSDEAIIKMLKSGAKGYILKDTDTLNFKIALETVRDVGYYHSKLVSNTLLNNLHKPNPDSKKPNFGLQRKELEFISLVCTELTYKEIAHRMGLSPRTIDGYRESIFVKLEVKSRVGLVLFAVKNNLANF